MQLNELVFPSVFKSFGLKDVLNKSFNPNAALNISFLLKIPYSFTYLTYKKKEREALNH